MWVVAPDGRLACTRKFDVALALRAALPPLVFIGLIMKEPDLGTALVCAAVTMAMLYLAGMQVKWLGVGILASSPIMFYMLWMVPFRRARLEVFFHPELDPLGKGFHIMQSLIAVGTGGFRGLGLMEGRQDCGLESILGPWLWWRSLSSSAIAA